MRGRVGRSSTGYHGASLCGSDGWLVTLGGEELFEAGGGLGAHAGEEVLVGGHGEAGLRQALLIRVAVLLASFEPSPQRDAGRQAVRKKASPQAAGTMRSPTDRHPDATNTPQRTTSLNQARTGQSLRAGPERHGPARRDRHAGDRAPAALAVRGTL
jgi:hypothetical protein